jgi:hypothetical protein
MQRAKGYMFNCVMRAYSALCNNCVKHPETDRQGSLSQARRKYSIMLEELLQANRDILEMNVIPVTAG